MTTTHDSARDAHSPRLLTACAMFGIAPGDTEDHARHIARARHAARRLTRLGPSQIALITGPSGSGKSMILRALAASQEHSRPATARPVLVSTSRLPRWRPGSVLDQFRGTLAESLSIASRAGLSEARVLASSPSALSDGQRCRLQMALAMERVQRRRGQPMLLIDEFCSTLDRTTACTIARMLRRWVRSSACRAVCACAADDLLEALAPDVLVYQPLDSPPIIVSRRRSRAGAAAP